MNEFTKGELLTIHLDMTIYANKASPLKESPVHKELREKIQRMIDNYCKHEKSTWGKLCDGYGNEFVGIKVCDKCHEVIDDNK